MPLECHAILCIESRYGPAGAGQDQSDPSDLRDSFAAQLAANRFVSNVQPDGDTITFSGLAADGHVSAWRIVITLPRSSRTAIRRFRTRGRSHLRGTPTGRSSDRRVASPPYRWSSPATASRRNVGPSGTTPRRDGNGSRRRNAVGGPVGPRRLSMHAEPVGRVGRTEPRSYGSAGVQQPARRHGIAGIHSNVGNVESVSYRIYRVRSGSNHAMRFAHRDSARIPTVFARRSSGGPAPVSCVKAGAPHVSSTGVIVTRDMRITTTLESTSPEGSAGSRLHPFRRLSLNSYAGGRALC